MSHYLLYNHPEGALKNTCFLGVILNNGLASFDPLINESAPPLLQFYGSKVSCSLVDSGNNSY